MHLPKIAPSTHAHFFLMAPLFINAGEGPIASFVAASENLHSRSNENLSSQIVNRWCDVHGGAVWFGLFWLQAMDSDSKISVHFLWS